MNKVISVYFSGTGAAINNPRLLAGFLFAMTSDDSESHAKFGYDGCDGILGELFGVGLDRQCNEVIKRVSREINQGHTVTLNVYGFSRGGIAALMLAKQLSRVDPKSLSINLALLDPVPGNLLMTARIDPLEISLANKVKDMRGCGPLKNVLALYLNGKFPALACHAPLIATYPTHTTVKVELFRGYHAQGEFFDKDEGKAVAIKVIPFLLGHGTQFADWAKSGNEDLIIEAINKWRFLHAYISLQFLKEHKDLFLESSANAPEASEPKQQAEPGHRESVYSERPAHSTTPQSIFSTKAICVDGSSVSDIRISAASGLWASVDQRLSHYPWLAPALTWTLVGLAVAGVLCATGGWAALPLLAPVIAKLGALATLLLGPAMGGALALVWYCAMQPVLMWCANKCFYPHYAMRDIKPTPSAQAPELPPFSPAPC